MFVNLTFDNKGFWDFHKSFITVLLIDATFIWTLLMSEGDIYIYIYIYIYKKPITVVQAYNLRKNISSMSLRLW